MNDDKPTTESAAAADAVQPNATEVRYVNKNMGFPAGTFLGWAADADEDQDLPEELKHAWGGFLTTKDAGRVQFALPTPRGELLKGWGCNLTVIAVNFETVKTRMSMPAAAGQHEDTEQPYDPKEGTNPFA